MSKRNKNKKNILLAEDDQLLSKTLKKNLEVAGFFVDVAHDGTEVFEKTKKGNFDLILLDIILPLVNGFDILEAFQNEPEFEKRVPPVIVISNLGQDENISRAMSLGAAKYFVKEQVTIKEIVEEVERLIQA